ncbi:hypothetical protein D018_1441A, partial [Vibrio parahaemolyticus VP2007-007]
MKFSPEHRRFFHH